MKEHTEYVKSYSIVLLTLLISATAQAQDKTKECSDLFKNMIDGKDIQYVSVEVTRSEIKAGDQFSSYFKSRDTKIIGKIPNRSLDSTVKETFSNQNHFDTGSAADVRFNFSEQNDFVFIHDNGSTRDIELTYCGKAPDTFKLLIQGVWNNNNDAEYSIYNITLVGIFP